MNEEILQAVFDTTEDGDLPFNGELAVESAEEGGDPVLLDESDLMEAVLIEAFEARIARAVAEDANPSDHIETLRSIDEAIGEGDYETALALGSELLATLGVDEARIEEFKKGFKVSAGIRNRMARARRKPKSGAAAIALRHRRRAARKSSSRMKRARYYKQNKRRIARRRAQLKNSVVLDANTVTEMADMGLTVLVVSPQSIEPMWATSREMAEALAADMEGGEIIELTSAQIAEARSKCAPSMSKKDDDEDEEDETEEQDESTVESEDDEDEEDDSEDDSEDEEDGTEDDGEDCDDDSEDDSEDDDEEDDEQDESIAEDQAAKVASEMARYMKQHPDAGYGEIATRFKVTRPVAMHAFTLAGRVAGSEGDEGSVTYLAKELMKVLRFHAGGEPLSTPPRGVSLPRKNLRVNAVQIAASVEDDGERIAEDGETAEGVVKHKKLSLPKPKLKGKAGAIKSAHARIESDDVDASDVVDEESTDEVIDPDRKAVQTHSMGKGRAKPPTKGATKLAKPKSPVRNESEEDDLGDDGETQPITVAMEDTEALIAAAAANGLDSETEVVTDSARGTVTMHVPADKADAMRTALAG